MGCTNECRRCGENYSDGCCTKCTLESECGVKEAIKLCKQLLTANNINDDEKEELINFFTEHIKKDILDEDDTFLGENTLYYKSYEDENIENGTWIITYKDHDGDGGSGDWRCDKCDTRHHDYTGIELYCGHIYCGGCVEYHGKKNNILCKLNHDE